MKGAMIRKGLIGVIMIISAPQWIMAKAVHPANRVTSETAIISLQSDTIPPPKKVTETPADKPPSDDKPVVKTIKIVPKARRQAVPVPINVEIKPVKIIKPKIIKPIIRGLH